MIARLGGIITNASGTLGALTVSNRRGVPVCSAKCIRTNQRTIPQQETQALYMHALAAYRELPALTQVAWKMYVLKHPFNNRLGVSRRYTPQQFFVSQALPRMRAGLGSPGSPPTKPQQSVGYPSTIAFAYGGPYTFNFIGPSGDPNGHYLVAAARTMSAARIGRVCFRQLQAQPCTGTCTANLYTTFTDCLGDAQASEIVVLSIRYAGANSIISAPVRWTLTVS